MTNTDRAILPLIIRIPLRVMVFVVVFFVIGLISAGVKMFVVPRWGLRPEDVDVYRGGLNMLAILWLFDLLARTPTHSGN